MKRDHLLGWPPALLALDPEPKVVPPRIILRPTKPLTPDEERTRALQDKKLTAALAPAPAPAPVQATNGYVYYKRALLHAPNIYRRRPDGVMEFWRPAINDWEESRFDYEQLIVFANPIVELDSRPEGIPE